MNIDKETVKIISKRIEELKAKGKLIFITTHLDTKGLVYDEIVEYQDSLR